MAETILKASNLSIVFGGLRAVDNFNIEIKSLLDMAWNLGKISFCLKLFCGELLFERFQNISKQAKVSVGFGGGGSDFSSKNATKENPFGGGVGAGVKVTPVAFLIVKEGNVRMIPVATPANTTADSLVEMIPDTLDKVASFIDSRKEKKTEE